MLGCVGAAEAHRNPAPVWLLLPKNDFVVEGAGGKQATKLWMGPSHLHSCKTAWATPATVQYVAKACSNVQAGCTCQTGPSWPLRSVIGCRCSPTISNSLMVLSEEQVAKRLP